MRELIRLINPAIGFFESHKKNKILFFGSLLFLFTFFSCSKTTKPCYTPSAVSIFEKDTITFTNCSDGVRKYDWDFGDGSVSSDKDPSHKFWYKGKYRVKLTVQPKGFFKVKSYFYEQFIEVRKKIKGCMDPAAQNYNSLANYDDGSCIYPLPPGTKTFWVSNSTFAFVELNVDDSLAGTIYTKYPSEPDCMTVTDCVRITAGGGAHTFSAYFYDHVGNIIHTVSSSFNISSGACELYLLE